MSVSAPTLPVLVDWPQIMRDLEEHGMTPYRVAKTLGVEHSTVQAWAKAKGDIGWGYGRALMSLHLATCGEPWTLQRLSEAKAEA